MSNKNCLPDNTQLGNLAPEQECTDCDPNSDCNCTMDDIIWSYAVTQCMSSLGLAKGQSLRTQLNIVYNLLCAAVIPTNVPCTSINMPGTYENMDYVGTQYQATYLDVLPGDFPNQYGIILNGTIHDFGSVADQATFLTALNALGLATFVYSGNNLIGTGYVSFGNVLIAGGDDGHITPTIIATGVQKNLCNFATAVDAEFGVINTEIESLQKDVSAVLYADTTPVSQTNTVGNLHGFTIPKNTLKKNGDSLTIGFVITKNDAADPANAPVMKLYFQNTANYVGLVIPAGSALLIGEYRIIRVSDTTVLMSGKFDFSITNMGQGANGLSALGTILNPPNMNGSPWAVPSLTTNDTVIQLYVTVPDGAKLTSTFLTIVKFSA